MTLDKLIHGLNRLREQHGGKLEVIASYPGAAALGRLRLAVGPDDTQLRIGHQPVVGEEPAHVYVVVEPASDPG